MHKTALATLFLVAGAPVAATDAEPAVKRERPSLPVGSAPKDELGKDVKGNELNALLAQKI